MLGKGDWRKAERKVEGKAMPKVTQRAAQRAILRAVWKDASRVEKRSVEFSQRNSSPVG